MRILYPASKAKPEGFNESKTEYLLKK